MNRITISIDEKIEVKIKALNEEMTKHANRSWSMAKTLNLVLLGGVLAPMRFDINDWHKIQCFADGGGLNLQEESLEEYVTNLLALRQVV